MPLPLHLDNVGAVRQYARGRAHCVDGRQPAADLWRSIWHKLEDTAVCMCDVVASGYLPSLAALFGFGKLAARRFALKRRARKAVRRRRAAQH